MKKILFVCGNPPHSVHEAFAKSINADFFYYDDSNFKNKLRNLWKIPRGYDIYFTEGLFSYTVLSKILGHLNRKSKIINLFADPRIYQIVDGKRFNFKKIEVENYPYLKKKMMGFFIKKLDGGICVGKYEEKILNNLSGMPTTNVPAFITNIKFLKEKAHLKENNILFIGWGPDYYYKGLDFLVEIFKEVSKESPNTKLYIVGGGWEKFSEKVKERNVIFLGKKNSDELIEIANKCSLMCHFGRGDTFPVTTLEIMSMGVPCFVSDETGTKEVVEKISSEFVISMKDKKGVKKKISDYLKKNKNQKNELSRKFRKIAGFYNEKNCINLFKSKFYGLIKEINKNESFNDKSANKSRG